MKAIIFMIIMFFMSSTLGASTDNYIDNQLGYTTYKSDTFSSGILSFEPNGYADLEFTLGMSKGLRRLEGNYQTDGNLLKRVIVWMSYRF